MEVKDRMSYVAESGVTYSIEETKAIIRAEVLGHMKDVKETGTDDPDAARILLLVGDHGEGKTRLLQQVAEEMGLEHRNFHAGAVDSQDNTGLQKVDAEGRTIHARPKHIPIFDPPQSKSGFGIFVIEEFGSNDNVEFQNQARQIAEGRLGELDKHPNWILAATSNPECDRYLTVNKLDAALVSRLCIIPVKTKLDEKLHYWRTKRGLPMFEKVYWFLLMNRPLIETTDSRSWYNLAKHIRNLEAGNEITADILHKAFKLHTTKEVAGAYEMFQKKGNDPDQYPISGDQLLHAEPEKFAVLTTRLRKWAEDHENCSVLLQATKHDAIMKIREVAPELGKEKAENIVVFADILGADHFNDMIQDLLYVLRDTRPGLANQVLNRIRGTKQGERYLALMDGQVERRVKPGRKKKAEAETKVESKAEENSEGGD